MYLGISADLCQSRFVLSIQVNSPKKCPIMPHCLQALLANCYEISARVLKGDLRLFNTLNCVSPIKLWYLRDCLKITRDLIFRLPIISFVWE